MVDDCSIARANHTCPLQDRQAHQDKIIEALMDRAEHATATELTDFGLFQRTILLEKLVKRRTDELNAALATQKAAETRIRYVAQHDPLTDLPNRALLRTALERQLSITQRTNAPFAVHWIDLDRFKAVNDTLGHYVGDRLLIQVAERFTAALRETDIVGRFGGDEFVLLQVTLSHLEDAAKLATRLIDILSQPYDLDGNHVTIGASVGVAIAPQDGTTVAKLLHAADTALYRAKSSGRGTFCFFQAEMDQSLCRRRELENDLIRAIRVQEFELAFQPLFRMLQPVRVIGFEALLRWPHRVRGLISPKDFLPLAEETGLIKQIGEWVLRTSCQEAATWPRPYRVAVNVSTRELSHDGFASVVASALSQSGLAADRLEIEITEGFLFNDRDAALVSLRQLKGLGVRIALDDFGTGFSSLSNLQRYPFDKIKIDKSFVEQLSHSEDASAIVTAIVTLSHQLHLEVTAEGVETDEQLDALRDQKCDQMQGFLLARPIPQRDLARYIAEKLDD